MIPLVLISCFQAKLIYFPRPYEPGATVEWQKDTGGKAIDFQTSQGKQRAFLQGNIRNPRNLWIVCGGNGTIALDWSNWLEEHGPDEDAWLLVDFPGYGDCSGTPSPEAIRESFAAVVPLAMKETAIPDHTRLRFFGHSLGAAACLIASKEFSVQRGVLISPFTTTMDMARHMTGLPVGWVVWHRFNNKSRLADLAKRGPGKVVIVHGANDEAIPIWMSRKLKQKQSNIVELIEIPGGKHNTIQDTNPEIIEKALIEIGK